MSLTRHESNLNYQLRNECRTFWTRQL